jgi:hypothetical protein
MAHAISVLKYHATRGLPWERLLMVKDKVSRRIIKPIDAWGVIKVDDVTQKEFATAITSEGGIVIYLSESDTQDLPAGDFDFDVVAVLPSRSLYAGNSNVTRPVAKGTLVVEELGVNTSLEEVDYMELRFKQYEDFYRTFTWRDENGDVIDVQNAYMQAKDTSGNTVLDIRWHVPALSDGAIEELDAEQRGYLTENADGSITLHISDMNSVPAGAHKFDLFVQDNSGDWTCLTAGAVIVEESISTKPT